MSDLGAPTIPLGEWFGAFVLSLAAELPVALWFFRREEPRRWRLGALAVYATLATHPLVWFVFPRLGLRYLAAMELAELFAWLAEAAFFRLALPGLRPERALVGAFLANGASILLVLVVRAAFDWP